MSSTESLLNEARLQVPPQSANRFAGIFAVLGLAGLGATAFGYMSTDEAHKAQALSSYLVAFLFVATLSVGGLFFTLLQHLVFARWSVAVRRIPENMAATTPVVVLLFIPIALGVKILFPWAAGGELEPVVAAKTGYLNIPFFMIRAGFYLLTWVVLSVMLYRRSVALDRTGDPSLVLKLRGMAPAGVLLFGITLTFAGFDWVMSLEPAWASTMFGVYIFAGTILSTLCVISTTYLLLQRAGYLRGVVNAEHYHDLGKLTFGFIVFWAYIAFSQFFLIWYANIPEETVWYKHHWDHGWAPLTVALVILHFAVPFFGLLSRHVKRFPAGLLIFSLLLIVMHAVDLFWIIAPLKREEAGVTWLDFAAIIGTTGVFLAVLANRIGAAPLVPVKDPMLADSLEYDNG